MRTFTFDARMWISHHRDEVFSFFSEVMNLEIITPNWLRFQIATSAPIRMQVGVVIDYHLRYRGIPVKWRSEILVWDPPYRFVDGQIKGPYRKWIHEHLFEEKDGGTFVIDHVEYAVSGGAFANWLVVRPDIEKIFEYRRRSIVEVFSFQTGPDSRHRIGCDGKRGI